MRANLVGPRPQITNRGLMHTLRNMAVFARALTRLNPATRLAILAFMAITGAAACESCQSPEHMSTNASDWNSAGAEFLEARCDVAEPSEAAAKTAGKALQVSNDNAANPAAAMRGELSGDTIRAPRGLCPALAGGPVAAGGEPPVKTVELSMAVKQGKTVEKNIPFPEGTKLAEPRIAFETECAEGLTVTLNGKALTVVADRRAPVGKTTVLVIDGNAVVAKGEVEVEKGTNGKRGKRGRRRNGKKGGFRPGKRRPAKSNIPAPPKSLGDQIRANQ